MPGRIVHFELVAADADRASGFWNGLFGWNIGESAMEGFDYRMFDLGDGQGGAIYPAQEGQSPGSADRLLRHRGHRRVDREGARARRHRGRQAAGADARLVRRLQGHGGQRLQPLARRRERSLSGLAVALAVLGGLAGSVQVAVMGRFGGRVGVLEALAFSTAIQLVALVPRAARGTRRRDRRAAPRRRARPPGCGSAA